MIKFEKVDFETFKNDFRKLYNFQPIDENNEINDEIKDVPEEYLKDIYDNINLPKRNNPDCAYYYLYLPFDLTLKPGMDVYIPTGIKVELPRNVILQIYPVDCLSLMCKIRLDNTVAMFDKSSSGKHIILKMTTDWLNNEDFPIKRNSIFSKAIFIHSLDIEENKEEENEQITISC